MVCCIKLGVYSSKTIVMHVTESFSQCKDNSCENQDSMTNRMRSSVMLSNFSLLAITAALSHSYESSCC